MSGPALAVRMRGAAEALSFAAAPSFALLALLTRSGGAPQFVCAHGGAFADMNTMYGLMALFHLSPWLRLLGRR